MLSWWIFRWFWAWRFWSFNEFFVGFGTHQNGKMVVCFSMFGGLKALYLFISRDDLGDDCKWRAYAPGSEMFACGMVLF